MSKVIYFLVGIIAIAALATCSSFLHAETPVLSCPGFAEAGTIPGTNVHYSCVGTIPDCAPGSHWNGTACVPDVVVTPPGQCAASQLSTPLGVSQFNRQCTGSVQFGQYHATTYSVTDLVTAYGDTSHPGPFPDLISGYTGRFQVQSRYYVSFEFVAADNGQMQFTTDPSYGDGGIISISTTPGAFSGLTVLTGGYGLCSYSYGAANSLWFGMGGADCPLVKGHTYFLNFADAKLDGTPLCFNGKPNTCSFSVVSYQVSSSH